MIIKRLITKTKKYRQKLSYLYIHTCFFFFNVRMPSTHGFQFSTTQFVWMDNCANDDQMTHNQIKNVD